MTTELYEIDRKLNEAKNRLATVFEYKGHTDREVLLLGEEVDRLLNQYNRLTRLC